MFFSFLFAKFASSERWAVLMAGSSNYYNYRHQADVFNMYQQLKNRGFDDSHIVLFAFDDISSSAHNPYQGQVFHTLEHINVYPGASKINYASYSVTSKNFYNALTYLPSTSEDYLFIFYDNHGGVGVLGVPDSCGGSIMAHDLANTFNMMSNYYRNYKYILFGIEACYSGSVGSEFTNPNMVTITSSTADESSYACVMDDEIGTYLTTEFSNSFMSFMDEHYDKTIGELYDTVCEETVDSHPCFFGDESMKSMLISDFLGTPQDKSFVPRTKDYSDAVPDYLATKSVLQRQIQSNDKDVSFKAQIELQKIIYEQDKLDETLMKIASFLNPTYSNKILYEKCGKVTPEYYDVLKYFFDKYGNLPGDLLPKLTVLVNLSNKFKVSDIKAAIDSAIP